ncbi:CHC2 zinc finger domain-containing protein [Dokdonella sp.]|uniref:DNA primase n=1 Tax=Dokdonella sp. TaxID=2291710 RepID=UPI0031BF9104|nr:DNA primase [Dokdonella sp.]
MAGRIPPRFIDELLTRVDVVDVVGERVQLRRTGSEWTACCPFHDERTPSFTVSPAKQFYHCFGCGAHGSAIGFLMNYDRLEFVDAVEELARRAGVEVPYEGGQAAPREDASELYEVLQAATDFYRRQLARSPAAQTYFNERGLDESALARFRLGYAPAGWDALKNHLGTGAQRIALLEKAGLLGSSERGRSYDRFRDRVMFPILDRRGRTIAFGGRVLAPPRPLAEGDAAHDLPGDAAGAAAAPRDPGPKYLNSPETPLFHKGRELFGLWQVREAHQKIPRLIVVEGYMDVISLHQYGVTQAVATLGTATTPEHAEILFRQAADVYFCFDGDRAGRQAAWRALESVLPRMRDGRQALFLFLPEGDDPDSLIRREGAAGFDRRLAQATPLSEFLFASLGKEANLATLDGKARLAERAQPLLARIPDGAFHDLMRSELARRTGVTLRTPRPAAGPAPARPAIRRSLVRAAIALLVQHPELARELTPPWPFAGLRQAGVALLCELLDLCHGAPIPNAAALLERYAGRDEREILDKLAAVEFPGGEDGVRSEFLDAIERLAGQQRRQRAEDLMAEQARGELDAAGKDELRALLAERATTG